MFDRIKDRIMVTNWSALPAPVWAVVAAPLLTWSGIGNPNGRWFNWPRGCSKSPFARSFWSVHHAFGREGSLWYNRKGQPRRFKPSNFDNPLSSVLNRSMFSTPGPRNLKVWERILLALGF